VSALNRLNGSRAKSLLEGETAMPRSNNRGGNNRNDTWSGGVMDMARDRPIAAAAVAAGAAAAGLFLWSRRSQISDQLSNLSDQLGEWTENMRSDWSSGDDTAGLTSGQSSTSRSSTGQSGSRSSGRGGSGSSGRSTTSRARGMSETGGGNASLGAHSGGIGTSTSGSPSGRGRAQSTPTTQQ
jgi:hypothetical protein